MYFTALDKIHRLLHLLPEAVPWPAGVVVVWLFVCNI